ncbi:MAG: DUF3987 domain-containing protein, partial [Candidatus Obscuribacterales bacterium]|nr:DUF3987 domain-containing protein [Candidatus Obscuribacterales bacterium]
MANKFTAETVDSIPDYQLQGDSESEWVQDVKPLTRDIPAAEPFPTEALPLLLREATESLHSVIKAPVALCVQSVLAAETLVLQQIADAEIDGRRYPISNFFLTLGASGERKSAVDKVVLKPIREHEAEQFRAYKKEMKRYEDRRKIYDSCVKGILNSKKDLEAKRLEIAKLGDSPEPPLSPIRLFSDPTMEGLGKLMLGAQPSLGLFSDEAGRMLGGHSMNDENRLKTIAT